MTALWPRPAFYSWGREGFWRGPYKVTVIGETPMKYVITAERDVPLKGGRFLKPGGELWVSKTSISFQAGRAR